VIFAVVALVFILAFLFPMICRLHVEAQAGERWGGGGANSKKLSLLYLFLIHSKSHVIFQTIYRHTRMQHNLGNSVLCAGSFVSTVRSGLNFEKLIINKQSVYT
jgi:hypothetical protein